ncbi:MAG: PQQ-binding-like beta-propeller repeat protein [Planctomycetota bacterium]
MHFGKMKFAVMASTLHAFVGLWTHACYADDNALFWHSWRGPEGTGRSETATPPMTWDESTNVRWKKPIEGRGTSTPIVWQDSVYLLTAVDTGKKDSSIPDPEDQPKTNFFDIKRPNTVHSFTVLCLDRSTGEERWRRIATEKIPHEGSHFDNDFASASPTTDGKRLFCWFGSAGMYCYTLDGDPLWSRDLGQARIGSSLGEGCSPVFHDGMIVIVRDQAGQSVVVTLDANSGEVVWEKTRDETNAWATPVIVERFGRTQVITAASGAVRSYDLNDGEIIWECSGLTGNVIPCPVIIDDQVICMSGYQGYSAMSISLALEGQFSIDDEEAVSWSVGRGTPYIPSPLLDEDRLYFNQSNQSILTCLNALTGEVISGPKRIGGLSSLYASPVSAGNYVYFTGRSGSTVVFDRGGAFEIVAVNRLDDRFDASAAIAGNQMFLRGEKYLYCLEQLAE